MLFVFMIIVLIALYFIGMLMYFVAMRDTETEKFLKENNLWSDSKWLWPIMVVKTLLRRLNNFIKEIDKYGGG